METVLTFREIIIGGVMFLIVMTPLFLLMLFLLLALGGSQ